MWMKLILSVLTSEMTKQLIGLAINKLLEHKSDGITKDVIEVVLDGAVKSRANTLQKADLFQVRKAIGTDPVKN